MEGDEWLGSGTSRNHVHHGSFYFQKVTIVQVLANFRNDTGSNRKDVANIVIDDQIQITLTVSRFLIGKTTYTRPSLGEGKHVKARTQEHNLGRKDGELSLFGFSWVSGNAYDISILDQLVDLGKGLFVSVRLGIAHDLHLCAVSTNVVKVQFSLSTNRHDAPRNGNRLVFQLFSVGGLAFVLGNEIGDPIIDLKFVWVGVDSVLFHVHYSVSTIFRVQVWVGNDFFFILVVLFLFRGSLGLGSVLFGLFLGGSLGLLQLLPGVFGDGISVLVQVNLGCWRCGCWSIFGGHGSSLLALLLSSTVLVGAALDYSY
mmetsp:Transcript_14388/g.25768  ORF Transcript_14388/g.25768 Transcript_14388/m.25768 type:complete len:314 (-) Transcript_14388:33-974(-)